MGVRYTKNGKIEDLNFTITMNSKCNLNCSYCPLINKNKEISIGILDEYYNFFSKNLGIIKTYVKNLVFIFFGGEPLLSFEKINYFISKTINLGIKVKYVIYTNGIFINEKIVNLIKKYENYRYKITFYLSIDGDEKGMLKNRLSNNKDFDKIISNIKLLKENNINFHISKVLYEKDSKELYNNFLFLDNLGIEKLDFLPVSFFYEGGYSKEHIKEIIKGLELFINYLENKGYSPLNIMEFFGLPDDLEGFKELYQSDYGLYGDLNGDIMAITDSLSIFSVKNTLSAKEIRKINLGNIKDSDNILNIIKNYKNFKKEYFIIGKDWLEREFSGEIKSFRLIATYLLKKLYLNKFKAQDIYDYKKFKLLTLLENYNYSDNVYPNEVLCYDINGNNILSSWKNYFITKNNNQKLSLVINIPFCETKCLYCTHEVEIAKNKNYLDNYIDYLEKESKIYFNNFGKIKLDYLYIGGGTPTILSEIQLERLFIIINKYFDLTDTLEKMIEFSPNTFSEKKVEIISKYGINKVTFGVQDIDENLMKENNRIQTKQKIISLFNSLRQVGIKYINIDIMAGLKGQSYNQFKNTLDFILSIKPDDICLNIFKPTNKILYNLEDKYFISDIYLLERNKMINYFANKFENKKNENVELYNFDEPNISFLSLGYGTNGHIFGKYLYKYKSLKQYFDIIDCKFNDYILGYELNIDDEIVKHVILNLKENGISFDEIISIFGKTNILDKIYQKIVYLEKKGLIEKYEKEGKLYYRYIGKSELDYHIYCKYFYNDSVLKGFLKLDKPKINIDNFLRIYFVN